MSKRKPLPPHWYRWNFGECPVCGSDDSYRERVYGELPEKIEDRYEYIDPGVSYDGCLG